MKFSGTTCTWANDLNLRVDTTYFAKNRLYFMHALISSVVALELCSSANKNKEQYARLYDR